MILEPGSWTDDDLSLVNGIRRKARKEHTCICAGPGRENLKSCSREPIRVGEVHIEYVGEVPAWQSGSRYHEKCWNKAWGDPKEWRKS